MTEAPPLTPVHHAGRLVVRIRALLAAARLDVRPIEWDHGDGRHGFRVMLDGRWHRVTVEPEGPAA